MTKFKTTQSKMSPFPSVINNVMNSEILFGFRCVWKELPIQEIKKGKHEEICVTMAETQFPHLTNENLLNNKQMKLQVWPKDGHVDHSVAPQRSSGRGGCLPAGRQALCCGWIWWPVISEHCGVLWCTEQRVDGGKELIYKTCIHILF